MGTAVSGCGVKVGGTLALGKTAVACACGSAATAAWVGKAADVVVIWHPTSKNPANNTKPKLMRLKFIAH